LGKNGNNWAIIGQIGYNKNQTNQRIRMKNLIYGAGIVGTTYGWLFSQAEHEVSVLVKKEKK
jgi:pyruvate/2-oxoglutarate dehydrogenase complex dihydrolipoamide dehydrogenase (E3) component